MVRSAQFMLLFAAASAGAGATGVVVRESSSEVRASTNPWDLPGSVAPAQRLLTSYKGEATLQQSGGPLLAQPNTDKTIYSAFRFDLRQPLLIGKAGVLAHLRYHLTATGWARGWIRVAAGPPPKVAGKQTAPTVEFVGQTTSEFVGPTAGEREIAIPVPREVLLRNNGLLLIVGLKLDTRNSGKGEIAVDSIHLEAR